MRILAPAGLALVLAVAAAGCGGSGSSSPKPPAALLHLPAAALKPPAVFKVRFATTKGSFTVTVHTAWAPVGATRFYDLVKAHFYDGDEFFRVVPGFVVQFGISPYPQISNVWETATIRDDAVKTHNTRGTVTFASGGPNSRTTQLFVNLADDTNLDTQGFAPFGAVTAGMSVVGRLYSGYGEAPSQQQQQIAEQGNAFLEKTYPKLDSIKTATVVAVSPG